ncbi:Serine-aspartate repeat-containing protein D precursor [Rubripirellula tenax]|uniref:Serine-aspartate repeat-containing protein D n=1 Tax=Rubripirellula tenax TaxID=2528015 RepID=A0A5C6FFA2_9BACT|nr:Ig-like domain-containing protein [Rubripirellula tenax]TWU58816.1 Serine-aspartate repeat-containing protein D precursor [Rubripirellula tenax]
MIKRNELNSKESRRQAAGQKNRKRRLTVEGLEKRELLAAGLPASVPIYTAPRNIGTVIAAPVLEQEGTLNPNSNDFFTQAQFIPLGTGAGQQDTIDVTGTLPLGFSQSIPPSLISDLDTYRVDLRAGDILDIAVTGAAGSITVSNQFGRLLYAADSNQGIGYPTDSPLQTNGNAIVAQVIPEDGTYFITVSPIDITGSYTMGLRAYRPIIESFPVGSEQIIFIDFDGGFYPRTVFGDPSGGVVRIPSLQQSLPLLGLEETNFAALNELIDQTIVETKRMFGQLGVSGNNGDFDTTGNPGDFGVTILNSRDHADPGFNPLVSRVILGGTVDDIEINTIGISSTLDIGNFSLDDIVIGALDSVFDIADDPDRDPSASVVDAMSKFLAFLISHEAGHSFGMRHTTSANTIINIMDEGPGADFAQIIGSGPDGIFGTVDDRNVDFVTDEFSRGEGLFGFNQTALTLSQTLGTGTVVTTTDGGILGGVGGRVFRDANGDGSPTGDAGVAGVTVYADLNNNRTLDASEPRAVTGADGTYRLSTGSGTFNIIVNPPAGQTLTTAGRVEVTVTSTSTVALNFGLGQTSSGLSGTVFADNDRDGVIDNGEGGIAGVYMYLDLDGDDRPDLGEPNTRTDASGRYTLALPGAGTYTVRQVVTAGFSPTLPSAGEYTVTFDGTNVVIADGNTIVNTPANFGLLPTRDFGDAPDTYGTTNAANGAGHGIIDGLRLGATVDRETNGQPSTNASGDDTTGTVDDEDGVVLLSPLGPGDAATFRVTATNTTGVPAFLQGFMDFNRDGDFLDVGEQFATNLPVAAGTVAQAMDVTVNVPANASVGSTFVRFRLSQTSGLGPTGFANSGEVEDYQFPILNAAEIANNDAFSVARNTLSNNLDVLANDFQTTDNTLRIDSLNTAGTVGQVVRSNDQMSIFYTPPNGFTGRDVFTYTVVDQFGNRSTATAVVNVTFQSNVPIAVDDSFEIAQDSSQRPLNVLDNDVPSLSGGISITSVTPGSNGGNIQIIGGGQSLRYTPQPGFTGTEEFTYSIQDSAGSISSATVTINLLPGSRSDDVVAFSIGIFDPTDINTPITNVQVGQEFLVRVSVEDLRTFANPEGVASAFMDLLYTDELVSTLDTNGSDDFPFDITFGPLFSRADGLQRANAQTPGLIDEVGGVQQITGQVQHAGPAELFTIRMRAVAPGVAQFASNPADDIESETTVLASDVALLVNQLRLGSTELLIVQPNGNFSSAIDDSFPDGRDSNGQLINANTLDRSVIDVLGNDNLGPTGTIREFGLVTNPSLGNAFIDDNGTPANLNDDFVSYRANANANGLERFTYVIVTDDNIRSTAEVTLALGNASANADVAFDFQLVGADGVTPITTVNAGDRFGVRIDVEDLRSFGATYVFAGYLDVLYSQGVIRPADTDASDEFNFDVSFGPGFVADAGVGTASRLGIINEFGTLLNDGASGNNPARLATLFFDAIAPGTAEVIGSPADSFPFQDTLLFNEDDPIDVSRIRYDKLVINVGAGTVTNPFAFQNPTLAQDVNNDGAVSPIDALLIINAMSRVTSPSGEGEEGSATAPSFFADVNGDARVSALDALQVINYLARQSNSLRAGGEGESIVAQSLGSTATDLSSDAASDAVFADLSGEALIADTSATGQPVAGSSTASAEGETTDSNDDSIDVLDLLAGDVSKLWN